MPQRPERPAGQLFEQVLRGPDRPNAETGVAACAQDIDRLCTECASLIDHHEKIAVLSAVHYNLGKTLRDVENIVALPHEAAEAEDMLRDDTQLLQVGGFLIGLGL